MQQRETAPHDHAAEPKDEPEVYRLDRLPEREPLDVVWVVGWGWADTQSGRFLCLLPRSHAAQRQRLVEKRREEAIFRIPHIP